MKIKDSVVFVTGASRGLGLAFAREALARGAAKVYAGVRNPEGFIEPGIVPVKLDVTDPASVIAAARIACDVTLLVNNAGIAEITESPFSEDAEDQARRIFETNFYGLMRVTGAFQASLPNNGSGGIINVLSDVTWRSVPILAPYSASKAAAWSYTNNIRLSLKERSIQVVGLHVGFVDTDLTKDFDVPKASPIEVVRQAYDAIETGESEVLADAGTRALKQSLSSKVPGYIDPEVLESRDA
ncbi:short-chain dehydrogenase [Pseudomonas sp. FW215-R2]|jgi:NAD(P)-dependent dehydrogenase (short-subunit alcohol dehydrogenase family)|uniref:SDR family oxidoreductase n=1 Tax=unclassified Pseudomonas TaxID=196821 RepID=UPI000C889276|nr:MULTISPECIES: SDR family oxidoreductase [unclassified Pseudomonas]PMX02325.1 short-chain dehydrogenase [Pseudomonas sp. FW215-R2]PMX11011.1 short-chain dehydrogenase [Pseudomonas sp. FW215-L1]PMX20804.1 short-chain dehydrogenase [Pseudomonas sp. FW215-E1]PNA25471.1 short-chain dehydrogenase [Pseudomonas sp. FW215-R4]